MRESCYRCRYCGTDRISDFTLADFWGIDPKKVKRKQMQLGVSVMCVNTDMAMEMLPKLSDAMYMENINPNEAIPHNLAFRKPGDRPKVRDLIFRMLENRNFDFVVKQVCWKYYMKKSIRRVIIKCIGESRYRKIMAGIRGNFWR